MTTMSSKDARPANKEIDPMDVERFLSSNMEFLKEWVMKNIGRSMLEAWVTEKQMAMTAAEVISTSRGAGAGAEMTVSVQKEQAGRATNLFEQVIFVSAIFSRDVISQLIVSESVESSLIPSFTEQDSIVRVRVLLLSSQNPGLARIQIKSNSPRRGKRIPALMQLGLLHGYVT